MHKSAIESQKSFFQQHQSRNYSSLKEQILFELVMLVKLSASDFNFVKEKHSGLLTILKKAPQGNLVHQVDSEIVPQGSQATHTAIKCPEAKDGKEFDLDSYIKYQLNPIVIQDSPYAIVKETYDAILPHVEQHDLDLKLKDRCITLKYAKISIDILPGVPISNGSHDQRLLIAEKISGHNYRLTTTNPLELQQFFEKSAEQEFSQIKLANHLDEAYRMSLVELSTPDKYPGVLRIAVMLTKRMRDNYFTSPEIGRKVLKSILINTFYAQAYSGQENLLGTLELLITTLFQWSLGSQEKISFLNPADTNEDFAKYLRESPEKLKQTRDFLAHVVSRLNDLKKAQTLKEFSPILCDLFGEQLAKKAISMVSDSFGDLQKKNSLYVSAAGTLASSGAYASTKTAFHGDA